MSVWPKSKLWDAALVMVGPANVQLGLDADVVEVPGHRLHDVLLLGKAAGAHDVHQERQGVVGAVAGLGQQCRGRRGSYPYSSSNLASHSGFQ